MVGAVLLASAGRSSRGTHVSARIPDLHGGALCVSLSRREHPLPALLAGQGARVVMSAYITSTGAFLHGPPIGNDEMEDILGYVDGKASRLKARILKANGIRTRHYAIDRNQRTLHSNLDMAVAAARRCLDASPVRVPAI